MHLENVVGCLALQPAYQETNQEKVLNNDEMIQSISLCHHGHKDIQYKSYYSKRTLTEPNNTS